MRRAAIVLSTAILLLAGCNGFGGSEKPKPAEVRHTDIPLGSWVENKVTKEMGVLVGPAGCSGNAENIGLEHVHVKDTNPRDPNQKDRQDRYVDWYATEIQTLSSRVDVVYGRNADKDVNEETIQR